MIDLKPTAAGIVAIAAAVAGEKLTFTRFAVGDGKLGLNEDERNKTALTKELFSVDIAEFTDNKDGTITVAGVFTSEQVAQDFVYREVGLYATVGNNVSPVLMAYGNAGDSAEYIPAWTDGHSGADGATFIEKKIKIQIIVGNAAKITAKIDPETLATVGFVEAKMTPGRNVGDIFYTARKDKELNGSVEAIGSIYNTADFSGKESAPALLEAGKLDYISMEAYEDLLKGDPVNGECFGGALWADGTYSANYTNYFKPDKNIPFSEADTWEFETRFYYRVQGGTTGRAILGCDETADCKGIVLYVNTSGVVCLYLSTNGTSWNLASALSMGVTLTAETEYDFKLGFDGTNYYFSYKLIAAEEWTTSWTLANATKAFSTGNIMLGNHRYSTAALTTFWNAGYIRLPRAKFLINGEVYWQGGTGRQAQKSVKAFGWDGPGATTFRVPTAEKPKRVLVAKKEATATDPSWWNWYSDGWLEQGDYITSNNVHEFTHLPRRFKNSDYAIITTSEGGSGDYLWSGVSSVTKYPTLFQFSHRFNGRYVAYGYAEVPTEADYQFQNIEVHRAMVQLAHRATDEGLATCTTVLSEMARFTDVMTLSETYGNIELTDNTIYKGEITAAVNFILPQPALNEKHHQIKAMLYFPAVAINWGTEHFFFGEAPYMETGFYSVYWDWDPLQQAWVCGALKRG